MVCIGPALCLRWSLLEGQHATRTNEQHGRQFWGNSWLILISDFSGKSRACCFCLRTSLRPIQIQKKKKKPSRYLKWFKKCSWWWSLSFKLKLYFADERQKLSRVSTWGLETINTWNCSFTVRDSPCLKKPVRLAVSEWKRCTEVCSSENAGKRSNKGKKIKSNKTNILHVFEDIDAQVLLTLNRRSLDFCMVWTFLLLLCFIVFGTVSVQPLYSRFSQDERNAFDVLFIVIKVFFLLFIFKGYLDFKYVSLCTQIVNEMFGQGSF